jgi:hypothetical protein
LIVFDPADLVAVVESLCAVETSAVPMMVVTIKGERSNVANFGGY